MSKKKKKTKKKKLWLIILSVVILCLCCYVAISLSIYNRLEAANHVKNTGLISVESLTETANLEVLQVSDVEYISNEEKHKGYDCVLEVPGNGKFTVAMSMAEFIIDDSRSYVLVRVPKPELKATNIEIELENVKILDYVNNRWIFGDGSVKEGEEYAKKQLSVAQTRIQEDIQSNERYFQAAKDSADRLIKQTIKSLNPDVKDLEIEVEFY